MPLRHHSTTDLFQTTNLIPYVFIFNKHHHNCHTINRLGWCPKPQSLGLLYMYIYYIGHISSIISPK